MKINTPLWHLTSAGVVVTGEVLEMYVVGYLVQYPVCWVRLSLFSPAGALGVSVEHSSHQITLGLSLERVREVDCLGAVGRVLSPSQSHHHPPTPPV